MIVIYRACPLSNPRKSKLIQDKHELIKMCFASFLESFKGQTYDLIVLIDKPDQRTRKIFDGYVVEETFYPSWDDGNIASFHRQIDIAVSSEHNDFLFIEDDYYFLPNAGKAIIGNNLPFYTPYDHPHWYSNPEFMNEKFQIVFENGMHWRTTLSCTLTFGGKTESLRQEAGLMKTYGWADHPMWLDITKRAPLFAPVPGLATHVEEGMLSLGIDWSWLQTSCTE